MLEDNKTELIALDQRIGTDVSHTSDFDDVMNTAGFGFNVERVPMHTPEGNKVKNNYIIRRDDTKRILGTCRSRYMPVQNDAMFEPFHKMVQKFGATYEPPPIVIIELSTSKSPKFTPAPPASTGVIIVFLSM